ncbi:hypothetical protein [Sporosarcina sp. Te-1]|nr:hypothetical protein [Sporosarcina sp. Te-1]
MEGDTSDARANMSGSRNDMRVLEADTSGLPNDMRDSEQYERFAE